MSGEGTPECRASQASVAPTPLASAFVAFLIVSGVMRYLIPGSRDHAEQKIAPETTFIVVPAYEAYLTIL